MEFGSSVEFQNGTSSEEEEEEEESFESESDLTELESDFFHSAEEDTTTNEDSVVIPSRRSAGSGFEDEVFMDNFSDGSGPGEDDGNLLGKLETEVMNLSLSRFRV